MTAAPTLPKGALGLIGELFRPAPRLDPAPLYAALHELGEIFWSPLGTTFVCGYGPCAQALRDPKLLAEDRESRSRHRQQVHRIGSPFFDSLLFRNGPDHRRLKSIAHQYLSERAQASLPDRIARATADRLRALQGATLSRAEIAVDIAWPLQLEALSAVLGLQISEIAFVQPLMDDLIILGSPSMWTSPEAALRADEASTQLVDYFSGVLDGVRSGQRTVAPTGLIECLVAEQSRGRLSGDEVLATLVALVVAGVDTTVGLVCNAIAELLTARRTDPSPLDGQLSDQLFNELLRLSSPIHVVGRRAAAGAELDGRSLPEGSHVVLLLGAANRDPRVFADPDRIVPNRRGPVSLAFGAGPHYCVGAALAKIQLSAVLPQLLATFPDLALDEPPTVGPHANPSHYSQVPVSLTAT